MGVSNETYVIKAEEGYNKYYRLQFLIICTDNN